MASDKRGNKCSVNPITKNEFSFSAEPCGHKRSVVPVWASPCER